MNDDDHGKQKVSDPQRGVGERNQSNGQITRKFDVRRVSISSERPLTGSMGSNSSSNIIISSPSLSSSRKRKSWRFKKNHLLSFPPISDIHPSNLTLVDNEIDLNVMACNHRHSIAENVPLCIANNVENHSEYKDDLRSNVEEHRSIMSLIIIQKNSELLKIITLVGIIVILNLVVQIV
jgi:hypothetical protein